MEYTAPPQPMTPHHRQGRVYLFRVRETWYCVQSTPSLYGPGFVWNLYAFDGMNLWSKIRPKGRREVMPREASAIAEAFTHGLNEAKCCAPAVEI